MDPRRAPDARRRRVRRGRRRRRARVPAWYDSGTGHFAFTRTGFYNSYARVATFADCSKFTPPAGTEKLCPRVPVEERLGHEWWIFAEQSPLWQHYGPSFAGEPPPTAAAEVSRFVRASVLNQPGAYLGQVGRDLWRVVNPGAASTVGRGTQDAGYGQREMIESFTNEQWASNAAMTAATNAYYHPSQLAITDKGGLGFYRTWERVFRFTGPLMLLTLLLACAAPFVAARGTPPARVAARRHRLHAAGDPDPDQHVRRPLRRARAGPADGGGRARGLRAHPTSRSWPSQRGSRSRA